MKNSLRLFIVAATLAATPALLAGDASKECCAAKTTASAACCAASKATASTGASCSAAEGSYVMVKFKRANNNAIQKSLASLDGVSAVETCPETKFTKVAYSKDKVCSDKIMAAIKSSGYKVEAQRITYAVEGMACGACETKVAKALAKVKGVSESHVCSQSKQAVVDFNPNKVSSDAILAALDAAGFKAVMAN
ncbi:MAG: copper ion binding protein [Verrucomicrobiales bacterium]|nr:copper ion binding protein [Verrucomicrobiales bacterium]